MPETPPKAKSIMILSPVGAERQPPVVLGPAANKQHLSSPTRAEEKAPAKSGNGAAAEAMTLATPMQVPPVQDENDSELFVQLTPIHHRYPSPMQLAPKGVGSLERDSTNDGVANEGQHEPPSVRQGEPEADDDLDDFLNDLDAAYLAYENGGRDDDSPRASPSGDMTVNGSFPLIRDDAADEFETPSRSTEESEESVEDEAELPDDGTIDNPTSRRHRETEEERLARELEESEALARQLMEEEAVLSYAASSHYLRQNADHFDSSDLAAIQAALAEEAEDAGGDEAAADGEGEESNEMSYDALLRLGENIGDVKEERWRLVSRGKIEMLPTVEFARSMAEGKEENHTLVKCQVCQFKYEEGDELRALPCGHHFHAACIDEWLTNKDTCALCRKSIDEEEKDNKD